MSAMITDVIHSPFRRMRRFASPLQINAAASKGASEVTTLVGFAPSATIVAKRRDSMCEVYLQAFLLPNIPCMRRIGLVLAVFLATSAVAQTHKEETINLDATEKHITRENFHDDASVTLSGNADGGWHLYAGAAIDAKRIDLRMRNVRGVVRFRADWSRAANKTRNGSCYRFVTGARMRTFAALAGIMFCSAAFAQQAPDVAIFANVR